jgi:CBS domain-containing protein
MPSIDSRCPQCGTPLPAGTPAWVRRLTVGQVMTPSPLTLSPEDSLMRGLELMRIHGVRRIPIVIGETLVGLLAEGDLKRAQPSTLVSSEEEFVRVMEETPVSRIMINNPIFTREDEPLLEAVHTLHGTKYGALPVIREGKLVGILTDSDLLRVLGELLEHGG